MFFKLNITKIKGKKSSEETKKKISNSLKKSERKKLSDINRRGKPNGQKGKIISSETREKIKNKLLGKTNKTKGMTWIYNEDLNKFKKYL